MKNAVVLWVMCLMPIVGFSQRSVLCDKPVSESLDAIYRFDESAYVSSLSKVADVAVRSYLVEYHSLMQYTAANNESNYKAYLKASDKALDDVDGHKYEATLLSNLHLHRCLVEMSNGGFVSGGIQFWKAYRSFKSGEDRNRGYDGQLMLRGIFNILLSQIPEKWKSLAGFLGFGSGDLQVGFKQIEEYQSRVGGVPGVREEAMLLEFANIFLSHSQHISESQSQELRSSKTPIVVYAYLLSNGRNCQGEEAEDVLSGLPDDVFAKFPLICHQRAKFALRRVDTEAAVRYADDFLKIYKGTACLNDAYLIKSYAYLLEGKKGLAEQMAKKALAVSVSSDVDKRTKEDAERVPLTDPRILKSRLLFEYGRYHQSLQYLKTFKPLDGDVIEYNFRMARACEKINDESGAMSYYNKVISQSYNSKRYFGPYSAIYAADLKIAQKDYASATKYVEIARKQNDGEFSKEIDQRISLTMREIERLMND